ncbi:MAG TPA: hypothetical protein VGK31_12510 [Thermoanaerobaculia bacterium]|jgi:hypothetical protein
MSLGPRKGQERRQKKRIQLTRGIVARYGATPTVILDITDAGARIEHFVRLDVGKKARFQFDWEARLLAVDAEVRSCRVHRFAHGEAGTTVFQSGLFFTQFHEESQTLLRDFVATHVARSLAEQVANARGLGPVIERNMPVFRSGVVATEGIDTKDGKSRRMIPTSAVVVDRGYVRCTLVGNHWEKKWSRTSEQPDNGFTVRASEPADHIDQLCETYQNSDEKNRQFIKLLAQVSVERSEETPEPRG